jgi:L-arabinose transport system substrate-binding protein
MRRPKEAFKQVYPDENPVNNISIKERDMKRIICVVLIVMMSTIAVFAGGGGQQAASGGQKQLTIAGIYKSGDQSWFLTEGKGAQSVVEAAGGKWMYMDTKLDAATYIQLIDTCIAQKVDGIVTCTPDQNLSQAVIKKLKEAGIPVVAVDDALQDENGNLLAPWVGIDAYNIGLQSGKTGVEFMQKNNLANDPAFGILLLTVDTVSSCVPRTEAQLKSVKDAFPNFPDSRIWRADSDGTTERANVVASAVITGHPEIKKWLVFAINDEGAQGGTRALEAAGLTYETGSLAIGFGGYLAPDEFAKPSSPFKAAVYFSATDVGRISAQALIDYIRSGKPIPERQAVPARTIVPGDDLKAIMPEYF